jgi:uncharacterized protein with von Willebrand factor type A (vWA) domain
VGNDDSKTGTPRAYRLILAYLADNPDAADTIDGVFNWWLLREQSAFRMQEVEEALSELVSQGIVIRRTGEDSRDRYQINRTQYEDILKILDQLADGEP